MRKQIVNFFINFKDCLLYFSVFRLIFLVAVFCFLWVMYPVFAQDKPAVTTPATDAAKKSPPPRHIAITDGKLGDSYANAYKNLEAKRKAVEDSPAWKDYVISQNQMQTTVLFIMAEMGIKPSDECKPVEKDGRLVHFECPVKEEVKPKP